MSITDKALTAAKVVAPELAVAELARERLARPPRKVKLHVRLWIVVLVVILAVIGLDRMTHFIAWPTPFGAQQTSPPTLDPILVEPTQEINLNESIVRRYPIDYSSPVMCTTFLGACVAETYSHKEVRATGVMPWYVHDNLKPSDIKVAVTQASQSQHGLITYTVTLAAPFAGQAYLDERTVHVDEFVDPGGHTTPIPTDQEIRLTALDETTKAAAADTVATTEAERVAGDSLKSKITAFVQPVLDSLSAKHLLNGQYDIQVNLTWLS